MSKNPCANCNNAFEYNSLTSKTTHEIMVGGVNVATMKITKCTGEGQGSCKRCSDNGKWNRSWMVFLYKIEGLEGCYCSDCVKEIEGGAVNGRK
jgi:hypothetical protein